MGDAYPELRKNKARVAQVLKQEEERFGETIENGMKILDEALAAVEKSGRRELDGETAFTLYDTFGFPFDLTADVCRERGVAVDEAGFEKAMDAQRERARAASQFKVDAQLEYSGPKTALPRLRHALGRGARDRALPRRLGGRCARQRRARHGRARSQTPFYAESGGQVGDRGELTKGGACLTLFAVDDTQKIQPDVFGHQGVVKTGELKVGDTVAANVDQRRGRARCATTRRRT